MISENHPCSPARIHFDSFDDIAIPKDFVMDPNQRNYIDSDGSIHVFVVQKHECETIVCPHCKSSHILPHGYSTRKVQVLPLFGHTTYFHIRQKRYICGNDSCDAETFIQPSARFKIFQQRSDELNMVIFAISVFCSDKMAEIICRSMGINVSHDSIRRLLSKIKIEDNEDVEIIGVDDVSLRKGQTYYTVVYDGEDHRLLALLEGRDGETLKEWLKNHPKVKMVARDRATAYANAIEEIYSDCVQVADRFHLFQNIMDRIKTVFKEELPSTLYIQDREILDRKQSKERKETEIRQEAGYKSLHYDNLPPVDENGEIISFIEVAADRNNSQYKRHEQSRNENHRIIKLIRQEWNEKKTGNKKQDKQLRQFLAKSYHKCEASIKKYIRMSDEEVEKSLEITPYKKKTTEADDYLNMIYKMLKDGIPTSYICRYVYEQGYTGTLDSLKFRIKTMATNNGLKKMKKSEFLACLGRNQICEIKRNDVLKYITIKDKNKMKNSAVAEYYELICDKYPMIKEAEIAWDEFYTTLMGKDPKKLDEFIAHYSFESDQQKEEKDLRTEMDIQRSPICETMNKFVKGIKKDIAPIKNAISFSLSSGFVEGGNCRYKLTKRLMFGRAKQEHLFHKNYAISIIMRQQRNPKELIKDWLNQSNRKIWPKKTRMPAVAS